MSTTEVTSADGFRIPVTEQGHGRPILIVHGGGGTSAAWAGVAGHLMARARSRRSSSPSPTGWGDENTGVERRRTGRDARRRAPWPVPAAATPIGLAADNWLAARGGC